MARRLFFGFILTLVVALSALGGGQARAQSSSDRLQSLRDKIAAAQAQESRLSSEIGSIETRIRSLETQVGGVSARLGTLERELALGTLYRRLVDLYESGEPTTVDVLLSSQNLGDFLDQADYVHELGAQDARISNEVHTAKVQMHDVREKTKKTREKVATVTRTIAARTAAVQAIRDRLVISKRGLAAARKHKQATLASVQESKREFLHEVAGIEASNAQVTAQLQAAGSSSTDSTPSASGLIWPVNGPVVSPFGMRWGRMHTGIDIAVPYGTPIHAAASGSVIFSGWMGGYGNFVIIDHGGGLATAYAHQSSIAVGGGSVTQGQVIGYVGCTGHCFGPHLHFEVRINGTPVDPMGYL